jgi:hypothetical protein
MSLVPPELQHPGGHVHRVFRARHALALHRRVSGIIIVIIIIIITIIIIVIIVTIIIL